MLRIRHCGGSVSVKMVTPELSGSTNQVNKIVHETANIVGYSFSFPKISPFDQIFTGFLVKILKNLCRNEYFMLILCRCDQL